MQDTAHIVLCACPDAVSAHTIAQALVDEKLAAAVNIIPEIRSIFRWQDKIENISEVQLIIITRAEIYEKVQARITVLHPYEVPQIIALPISQGSQPFLTWIKDNVA